jgi:hypothetical protein
VPLPVTLGTYHADSAIHETGISRRFFETLRPSLGDHRIDLTQHLRRLGQRFADKPDTDLHFGLCVDQALLSEG